MFLSVILNEMSLVSIMFPVYNLQDLHFCIEWISVTVLVLAIYIVKSFKNSRVVVF